MEKTTSIRISPMIVLALSFCVSGVGMIGYLYYSDHISQQFVKDATISTKVDTQKDVTVYEITNKETSFPIILPSKIQIIEDQIEEKDKVLSINEIFSALWIPLLIIGSYILVHSDKGIISKVRV